MAGYAYEQEQQQQMYPGGNISMEQEQGQIVKIFSKADKTFSLGVRNDTPVMVPADSNDPTQFWVKDLSYGERTKDNYGCPAFVLINKATGKALKHGKEKGHQVCMCACT